MILYAGHTIIYIQLSSQMDILCLEIVLISHDYHVAQRKGLSCQDLTFLTSV